MKKKQIRLTIPAVFLACKLVTVNHSPLDRSRTSVLWQK